MALFVHIDSMLWECVSVTVVMGMSNTAVG